MPDKELDKLEKILGLLDDGKASQEEVVAAFEALLSVIEALETERRADAVRMEGEQTRKAGELERAIERVREGCMRLIEESNRGIKSDIAQETKKLKAEIEAVRGAVESIPEPETVDAEGIASGLVEQARKDIERQIKELRELLNDTPSLEKFAELEKKVKEQNPKGVSIFGGPRGIQLYVNGLKKGMVSMLNLIPGTGVTMTYSQAFGRNDITISASGGSFSILTATGTVDDSNTDFTFESKPSIVVVNGASYQENKGWSWNSGTLTATLDFAPGSGGNVYGLG